VAHSFLEIFCRGVLLRQRTFSSLPNNFRVGLRRIKFCEAEGESTSAKQNVFGFEETYNNKFVFVGRAPAKLKHENV